jgi:hypothetical protein
MEVPEKYYKLYPEWMLNLQRKLFNKTYGGTTLWPFGIYASRESKFNSERFKRHEGYHWDQQKSLLGIGFYILYLIEYGCYRLFHDMNHDQAYRNLAAEQEAYMYENDKNYPKNRTKYGWLRFIFTKIIKVK